VLIFSLYPCFSVVDYRLCVFVVYGVVLRVGAGRRVLRCPKCGFEFDVSYARATACLSCVISVRGCQYIKCPRCGYEWLLS